MIKVYGCSDDLVECEGAEYPNDEIGCYNHDVVIVFKDGTEIKVGYPKRMGAIWWIKILHTGTADHSVSYCDDEEAEIYSDVFIIDSDINSIAIVPKEKT